MTTMSLNDLRFYHFKPSQLDKEIIYNFLISGNKKYTKILSDRVNMCEYSKKLSIKANNFIVKKNNDIVSYSGTYFDMRTKNAFISTISVSEAYLRHGIGQKLIDFICDHALKNKLETIKLEEKTQNKDLEDFYLALGFNPLKNNMFLKILK